MPEGHVFCFFFTFVLPNTPQGSFSFLDCEELTQTVQYMSDHIPPIGMPFLGIGPVTSTMPQSGGYSLLDRLPGLGMQLTSNLERPRGTSDGSNFWLKLLPLYALFCFYICLNTLCLTFRTWLYCCPHSDQPFKWFHLNFLSLSRYGLG